MIWSHAVIQTEAPNFLVKEFYRLQLKQACPPGGPVFVLLLVVVFSVLRACAAKEQTPDIVSFAATCTRAACPQADLMQQSRAHQECATTSY